MQTISGEQTLLDMEDKITQFYLDKDEPLRSALLGLRDIIMDLDPTIQAAWKYSAPFFVYRGKNLCYLWVDKRNNHPYIGLIDGGMIEHPLLDQGDRKSMKVLPINPEEDFPMEAIQEIFAEAMIRCAERARRR